MNKKHIWVLIALVMIGILLGACSKGNETNENETSQIETTSAIVGFDFDAEKIAGNFVDDFLTQSFDVLLKNYTYSADMKAQFTKETMQEIYGQLEKSYGASDGTYGSLMQQKGEMLIVSIGVRYFDVDLSYNIVFNKIGEVAGFNYNEIVSVEAFFGAPIEGAIEKEVTFGSEAFLLEGTLSIPQGDKDQYPVAILVHGSGPNDRDETMYGNKPFRDLAMGLIEKGIAVLRYDKRTLTHSAALQDEKTMASFTIYDEVIDDASYAVDFLKTVEGIDPNNIFIVGHSLGGNQAPRIAKANSSVAGIAILAGNVSPIQRIIEKQYEYLLGLDGSFNEGDKAQLKVINDAIAEIESPNLKLETESSKLLGLSVKYWMDLRDYNPVEIAKTLNIPVLIMQGARDYQVTVEEFELWRGGLGDLATYKLYDDLNHLFISGEGPSMPAEYTEAGKVSSQVIDDLSEWINSNQK